MCSITRTRVSVFIVFMNECKCTYTIDMLICIVCVSVCVCVVSSTWQASTPPARKPLQSILEVTCPSVTTLHTESLMIFTSAFCSSRETLPEDGEDEGGRRKAVGKGGEKEGRRVGEEEEELGYHGVR